MFLKFRTLLCIFVAIIGMHLSSALAQTTASQKIPGHSVVASLCLIPKADNSVTLLVAGNTVPLTEAIEPNLVMSGWCHDCNMLLHFPAKDAGKKCATCPCEVSNGECVAWQKPKPDNWQGFLQSLPRGTGIHIEYRVENKPESGLKSLEVDRKIVLLPITGMGDATPPQLLALVKPFGGTEVERVADNTQLLIHLKADWTIENEIKFEKAVGALGGKMAWPSTEKAMAGK